MDKKLTPGAPPSGNEPPTQISNLLAFSHSELMFLTVDRNEDINYVLFKVGDRFICSVKEFDYFAYLNKLFTLYAQHSEEGENIFIDECSPDFEKIDMDLGLKVYNLEGESVNNTTMPFYVIFNLAENLNIKQIQN